MIVKIIGLRRMLLLVVAVALNVVTLLAYFGYIEPQLSEAEARKANAEAQVADLNGKSAAIKDDLDFVEKNRAAYEALKGGGFFSDQDRFAIERAAKSLREESGVSKFSLNIDPLGEIRNADAAAAKYRLIDSHIKFEKIESLVDTNIFALAQGILGSFPKVARISSLTIARTGDVTQERLSDIIDGKPVSFVTAEIEFDWITAVPVAPPPAPGAAQPQQFRGQ